MTREQAKATIADIAATHSIDDVKDWLGEYCTEQANEMREHGHPTEATLYDGVATDLFNIANRGI